MILLNLATKDSTNKAFIKSWAFMTKEQGSLVKEIAGIRVVVNEKILPPDFYKSHNNYFFENGKIRYRK